MSDESFAERVRRIADEEANRLAKSFADTIAERAGLDEVGRKALEDFGRHAPPPVEPALVAPPAEVLDNGPVRYRFGCCDRCCEDKKVAQIDADDPWHAVVLCSTCLRSIADEVEASAP